MIIKKESNLPAYYQIKNYILENIKNGVWSAGDCIISEIELSEKANVSRMTVRQAMGELVSEGILYRIKGKGTFVSSSKIEQKDIMSFSAMLKAKGIEPVTKVLEFEMGIKALNIAEYLGLEKDTEFYRLKRLRCAGDEPVGIEENYIPMFRCIGLENFDLSGSLYEILLNEYQYKIGRIDVTIEAAAPLEDEVKLLNIEKGLPLLRVSGNSISNIGVELFYEKSCYRSDIFSYKASIFNKQDY